jgi:hypothetical protein
MSGSDFDTWHDRKGLGLDPFRGCELRGRQPA